jgi:hypothetical protein
MNYEIFKQNVRLIGLNNKRFGELIGVEGRIVNHYKRQGVPKMSALLVTFMLKLHEAGESTEGIERLALGVLNEWSTNKPLGK